MLEQILFILCFFSGMPRRSYLKGKARHSQLKVAGELLRQLNARDPVSGRTYWEQARRKGKRVRKFARYPASLRARQRELNEPSHFSIGFRKVDEPRLRLFVGQVRPWFDKLDKYLIVAAVNELLSDGKFQATLSSDSENSPGVRSQTVIRPKHLERTPDGRLALRTDQERFLVVSDSEVPRDWPRTLVLPKGAEIVMEMQFVTKRGAPVNLSNMEGVIRSLAKTKGQRAALTRRLREIGFDISWRRHEDEAG